MTVARPGAGVTPSHSAAHLIPNRNALRATAGLPVSTLRHDPRIEDRSACVVGPGLPDPGPLDVASAPWLEPGFAIPAQEVEMDDRSIVSSREQEIDAEVEAERKHAQGLPARVRDEASTETTGAAAPNDLGGAAGVAPTTTGSEIGAGAQPQGTVPPASAARVEDDTGTEQDVRDEGRPGETYSPRSG